MTAPRPLRWLAASVALAMGAAIIGALEGPSSDARALVYGFVGGACLYAGARLLWASTR